MICKRTLSNSVITAIFVDVIIAHYDYFRQFPSPAVMRSSARMISSSGSLFRLRQLLDGDPNFIFDADTAQWRLAQSDRLPVGLDEAEFTVLDLETTGGRAGPARSSKLGQPTEWLVSGSRTLSRSWFGPAASFPGSSRASRRLLPR